ncbi:amino acid permease [Pseudomonas sp. S2_A02]
MNNDHVMSVSDNGIKDNDLKRRLENRHIQLISISGAIGTGLFMGSGKVIALAGTSIILVYAIIGFFIYCVMRAMGEMLLSNLKFNSFADIVTEYLGQQAGFSLAWTYWLCWCVAAVADMIMVAGFFQYWYPDAPSWAPAFITAGILIALNLLTVKVFGEVEFWLGIVKILAIVALVLTSVMLVLNSFVSPSGVTASFSHLIEPGSILPHGIMGFFAGFQIAVFSFNGTELIGTTAAEAKDPERTIKRAINTIPFRILLFYVLALAGIISVISWAQVPSNRSPFVELFLFSGLPAAAGIINFVVLTSAASSANSGVYSAARMLFSLSKNKRAPVVLGRITKGGVPGNAIVFTGVTIFIGLALLFFIPEVMTIFTLVSTVAAVAGLYTWSMIILSYVVYRKRNPSAHLSSSFKFPGGVPMAIIVQGFIIFILCLLFLESDTRTALYVMPYWFIFLVLLYKYKHKKNVENDEKTPVTCA